MTTTTHTPAPWRVMEPGTETVRNRAVVCAQDGLVRMYDEALTEENIANARLIAAAPALLAACKYALTYWEDTDAPMAIKLRAVIYLAEKGTK